MIVKIISLFFIASAFIYAVSFFSSEKDMESCLVYTLTGGACSDVGGGISLHHLSMIDSISKYVAVFFLLLFFKLNFLRFSKFLSFDLSFKDYIFLKSTKFYFSFLKDIIRWLNLKFYLH